MYIYIYMHMCILRADVQHLLHAVGAGGARQGEGQEARRAVKDKNSKIIVVTC